MKVGLAPDTMSNWSSRYNVGNGNQSFYPERRFYVVHPIFTLEEETSPCLRSYEPLSTQTSNSNNQEDNRFYHGTQMIINTKFRYREDGELRKTFAARYPNTIIKTGSDISGTLQSQLNDVDKSHGKTAKKRKPDVQITLSQKQAHQRVASPSDQRLTLKPRMSSSSSFETLTSSSFSRNGPIPLANFAFVRSDDIDFLSNDDDSGSSPMNSPPRESKRDDSTKSDKRRVKEDVVPPRIVINKTSKASNEIIIKSKEGGRENLVRNKTLTVSSEQRDIDTVRSEILDILGLPKNATISNFVFQ